MPFWITKLPMKPTYPFKYWFSSLYVKWPNKYVENLANKTKQNKTTTTYIGFRDDDSYARRLKMRIHTIV